MAERRMFAKTIIDSDAFLEMPQSTQLLYFHLGMRADDDGFVNKPKSIIRIVGCKDDDMKILCAKKFIIPFDTGIVVIKHWKIHNYIAKDRYHETKYKKEKSALSLDENSSYTECRQLVYETETQVRLGKVSIGKEYNDSPAKAIINQESVDSVYIHYPSRCIISNRSTGKSTKNKDKIRTLLRSGQTAEGLCKLIDSYVTDCKNSKTYLKNFGTFLNNLPDLEEVEKEKEMTKAEIKELKRIGAL